MTPALNQTCCSRPIAQLRYSHLPVTIDLVKPFDCVASVILLLCLDCSIVWFKYSIIKSCTVFLDQLSVVSIRKTRQVSSTRTSIFFLSHLLTWQKAIKLGSFFCLKLWPPSTFIYFESYQQLSGSKHFLQVSLKIYEGVQTCCFRRSLV